MAQELLSLVEAKSQEKGLETVLRIENCISESHHKVRSDEARIKKVLFILLLNVIRVAERGTTIHVDIYMKTGSEEGNQ